eukprot:jgi/Chlat1/1271/Chrsp117S08654
MAEAGLDTHGGSGRLEAFATFAQKYLGHEVQVLNWHDGRNQSNTLNDHNWTAVTDAWLNNAHLGQCQKR